MISRDKKYTQTANILQLTWFYVETNDKLQLLARKMPVFQHLLQANAARNLQVVNMNPLCLNALLLERTFHFMQSR